MLSPRFITVVGLFQVLIIGLGFLGLGIVMKMLGWPGIDGGFRFSSLAIFLRIHSLGLMLIPIFWTVAALWIETKSADDLPRKIITFLGIASCVCLISAYMLAICAPGYMPFTILR
jgi:hypothetical protein